MKTKSTPATLDSIAITLASLTVAIEQLPTRKEINRAMSTMAADIADTISGLATDIDNRFTAVDNRLEHLEDESQATRSAIHELYKLATQ